MAEQRPIRQKRQPLELSKKDIYNYFFIFLAIFGVIFCFIMLSKSSTDLEVAEARLTDIEEKLYNTDESQNKSVSALQAVLRKQGVDIEANIKEIKKLWVIAHQTNSKDIKSLKLSKVRIDKELKNIDNTLDQISTLVNKVSADQTALVNKAAARIQTAESSINKVNFNVEQLEVYAATVNQDLLEVSTAVADIEKNLRKQSDLLVTLETTAKNKSQTVSDLTVQLADFKESIAAINNHRRMLNVELSKLKKKVDAAEATPALKGG